MQMIWKRQGLQVWSTLPRHLLRGSRRMTPCQCPFIFCILAKRLGWPACHRAYGLAGDGAHYAVAMVLACEQASGTLAQSSKPCVCPGD
jgi:hypothetical protein